MNTLLLWSISQLFYHTACLYHKKSAQTIIITFVRIFIPNLYYYISDYIGDADRNSLICIRDS